MYRLIVPLLLTVTVHGTQQGKARKLRKQRVKRKERVNALRQNDVAPPQGPLERLCGAEEGRQSITSAMVPSTVAEGMMVYLKQEGEEGAMALEVPREATVADLAAAAATAGVDIRRRTLTFFCSATWRDPSALLSDIGLCAESVIDVSRFVWNRETLNELQPIFEAEVVVQGGENQIVFLKWDTHSACDLDTLCTCPTQGTPVGDVDLKLWFQIPTGEWTEDSSRWSKEQRDVWEYLQLKNNFIRVDVSSHISVKVSIIDIDLPFRCPLATLFSTTGTEQLSVILKRVVHLHDNGEL